MTLAGKAQHAQKGILDVLEPLLQNIVAHCNTLQHTISFSVAVCCSVLQCVAVCAPRGILDVSVTKICTNWGSGP